MLGLRFFETRHCNDERSGICIASRHPIYSPTWYWHISLERVRPDENRTPLRYFAPWKKQGQWFHRLNLIFGWYLIIGFQDYHRSKSTKIEGDN